MVLKLLLRMILLIRGLLLPFWLAIYTAICCTSVLVAIFILRSRFIEYFLLRIWAKHIVWVVGLRLHVTGLDKIPPQGVLFIFNHQSLLDIPVIHSAIPRDLRFGAKIELFSIPIFGRTMRAMRVLPIPRGQREEAIRVLERSAVRIKKGESFILAPEGTRQKENQLGEFRSGPFILSIQAGCPLVPVVLRGIHDVLPKNSLLIHTCRWVTDVNVDILDPINGAEFNFPQREDFKKLARDRMLVRFLNN